MLRALVTAVALLFGIASASPAIARDRPCANIRAERVDIATLKRDFRRWAGKCVRVRGIAFEGRLYADRQALIPIDDEEDPSRSLVIFRMPRSAPPSRRPAMAEATGRLQSCILAHEAVSAYAAAHPDEIVWPSGYCHTSSETYLTGASLRVLPSAPIVRLTEREVPPVRRQLADLPATAPDREGAISTAGDMLTAVASGDRAAFNRIHSPHIAADTGDDVAGISELRRAYRASRQRQHAAAALMPRANAPDRLFVDRQALTYAEKYGFDEIVACWCTTGDCAGRWPVTFVDADNLPSRPYFCIVTTEDFNLNEKAPAARLTIEKDGFSEPRW